MPSLYKKHETRKCHVSISSSLLLFSALSIQRYFCLCFLLLLFTPESTRIFSSMPFPKLYNYPFSSLLTNCTRISLFLLDCVCVCDCGDDGFPRFGRSLLPLPPLHSNPPFLTIFLQRNAHCVCMRVHNIRTTVYYMKGENACVCLH